MPLGSRSSVAKVSGMSRRLSVPSRAAESCLPGRLGRRRGPPRPDRLVGVPAGGRGRLRPPRRQARRGPRRPRRGGRRPDPRPRRRARARGARRRARAPRAGRGDASRPRRVPALDRRHERPHGRRRRGERGDRRRRCRPRPRLARRPGGASHRGALGRAVRHHDPRDRARPPRGPGAAPPPIAHPPRRGVDGPPRRRGHRLQRVHARPRRRRLRPRRGRRDGHPERHRRARPAAGRRPRRPARALRRARRAARAAHGPAGLREGLPGRAGRASRRDPPRRRRARPRRRRRPAPRRARGPGPPPRPGRARRLPRLGRRRPAAGAVPGRRPLRGPVAVRAVRARRARGDGEWLPVRRRRHRRPARRRRRRRRPPLPGRRRRRARRGDDARALRPGRPPPPRPRGARARAALRLGRRRGAHGGGVRRGRRDAYPPGVPELLLVATTQGFDARDLVRALERQAPDGVTVRSAPGLLAPRRDGDGLVREAARERGATGVVVAPGGPDLASHALLTVEGARSVGLPVAAVVVAGPGGADQRAVLREHAGAADVVELPDPQAPSSAVATWPLREWAVAEPAPDDAAGGDVALAPYSAWETHSVPDPRAAGRGAIDPVLAEIVAAEGPVLASRAYGLYNKAAGGKKLTTIVRAPLSAAAYRLRMAGRIEIVRAEETPGQGDEVLRMAGSPRVRVRELGPRALDEVPLEEIAELMERLTTAGADDLKRAVLDAYGLVRLTAKADDYLEQAFALTEPS